MTDAFASLAAIAVEIEKWKAVEAKKRMEQAALAGNRNRHSDSPVPENLPEPVKDRSKESSEQTGAMLGVVVAEGNAREVFDPKVKIPGARIQGGPVAH